MNEALQPFFDAPPFGHPSPGSPTSRSSQQLQVMNRLTAHHRARCVPYDRILQRLYGQDTVASTLSEVPMLPVGLFKTLDLHSVPDDQILRVLHSSGTTGQIPSRIVLDRDTAGLQRKALSAIMQHVLGPKRRPMIIADARATLKDKTGFTARAAGIAGMMNFGRNHTFVLDDAMHLDAEALAAFATENAGQPCLMFGFTFMVWQYLVQPILRGERDPIDLSGTTLVHSGGWKKLHEQAVTNAVFKDTLRQTLGITEVRNFYGMVEQVGAVYIECDAGHFHASGFGDVIIRDHTDWQPLPTGEKGVLQTLSVLPWSYPGHSLLTEDLATIHGVDDCPCGDAGTYFSVSGRIPRAELRGCSDTHAASVQ